MIIGKYLIYHYNISYMALFLMLREKTQNDYYSLLSYTFWVLIVFILLPQRIWYLLCTVFIGLVITGIMMISRTIYLRIGLLLRVNNGYSHSDAIGKIFKNFLTITIYSLFFSAFVFLFYLLIFKTVPESVKLDTYTLISLAIGTLLLIYRELRKFYRFMTRAKGIIRDKIDREGISYDKYMIFALGKALFLGFMFYTFYMAVTMAMFFGNENSVSPVAKISLLVIGGIFIIFYNLYSEFLEPV